MQRTEVLVNLGERSYPIVITSGELPGVGAFARGRTRATQALVVADTHTAALYATEVSQSLHQAQFQATLVDPLPAGEDTKSLHCAESLYSTLIAMAADRGTLLVALGGGVIGDLAGYVAATYLRGIPYLQVPTSLLAQVDSSVGGKVAINLRRTDQRFKNVVGAFYQPIGVFIDTEMLRSLPEAELRAGLAEVVKYGMILDAELFSFLESHAAEVLALEPSATQHIVARSCRLKADVVEADEREVSDRRAILNYGHTFAHAIEAVSTRYRHGEAVAIGMVAASRLAERLGRVGPDVTARQQQLLERLGLPVAAPGLSDTQLLSAMHHDKKVRAGRLRFVLPSTIGSVDVVDGVAIEHIQAVLSEMVRGPKV